jgi:hypothetical protein
VDPNTTYSAREIDESPHLLRPHSDNGILGAAIAFRSDADTWIATTDRALELRQVEGNFDTVRLHLFWFHVDLES